MNNLTIPAYSEQAAQAVKERLDSLAKVPGSLGKLATSDASGSILLISESI